MHRIFTGLAAISAILTAASFVAIYKELIEIPPEYQIPAIASVPGFALLAVIFEFISSSIRQRRFVHNTDDSPTGPIPTTRGHHDPHDAGHEPTYSASEIRNASRMIPSIVGRIIVAAAFTYFITRNDPQLIAFIPVYIVVSYFWIIIKLIGKIFRPPLNYIIGLFAGLAAYDLFVEKWMDKLGHTERNAILIVLIIGVFVIDIAQLIRYFVISSHTGS